MLPIQPVLMIIDTIINPEQICVYFDRIRYKFECVGRATDAWLKIFLIFNLEYTTAAKLFWSLIQSIFAIMNNEKHASVNKLINELKSD